MTEESKHVPVNLFRMFLFKPGHLLLSAIALFTCFAIQANEPGQQAFNDICRACHQQSGHGIKGMQAPSIAGLPRWYVSHQLRQFASGARGGNSSDRAGQLMSKMVTKLDDVTIAHLARYIQKELTPVSNRQTTKHVTTKEIAQGKTLYLQNCQSCHADKGSGNRSGFIPPLNKQQDWYLYNQIEKFTNNVRQHPIIGSTLSLDYPQSTAIVAYLSSLKLSP